MRQLPPLQQPADARSDPRGVGWSSSAWLESLHLHECVAATFCPDAAAPNQFEVMRKLSRDHIRARLASSILVRELTERIAAAAQALNQQAAPTASALNSKFTSDTSRELSYGSLEVFYGGLDALIGPPIFIEESLWRAMEYEHTEMLDSDEIFRSSNGMCAERVRGAGLMPTNPDTRVAQP